MFIFHVPSRNFPEVCMESEADDSIATAAQRQILAKRMGKTRTWLAHPTQYGAFQLVMGVPQKWLIYNRKSHLEMDHDWGYPHDYGNHRPYLHVCDIMLVCRILRFYDFRRFRDLNTSCGISWGEFQGRFSEKVSSHPPGCSCMLSMGKSPYGMVTWGP